MDEMSLGLLVAYSKPVLFVLALALASIAVLAIFVADPKWPTLALFIVILSFVNPSYGFLDKGPTNIYAWGTGKMPFPLFQFYLYGLFLAVLLRNQFAGVQPLKQAGGIWLILFALMYFGHFVVGLSEGKHFMMLLQGQGLIHVLHMGMMVYIVASVLNNEKDINAFIKIFLVIAVGRAVFGLARYFLFDGDPQNAYENLGKLNVKLTYWDLVEGLVASMVAFYFMWRLTHEWSALKASTRWLFIGCLLLELMVIILSFRRTNLFGLLLVGAYFLTLLPWRKRIIYSAVGAVLLIPPVLAVSAYRAQEVFGSKQLSLMEIISPDASDSHKLTARGSRFYELYLAAQSIQDKPIVGVGIWNGFKVGVGDASALAYHRGNYGFIHSGIGHVMLKSGLLGVTLFLGILLAAWRYVSKAKSRVPLRYMPLLEAYRAGLWFMIPTLLFGTPIVELRTMMWLAMLLAVPIALTRFSQPQSVPQRSPSGSHAIAQPA